MNKIIWWVICLGLALYRFLTKSLMALVALSPLNGRKCDSNQPCTQPPWAPSYITFVSSGNSSLFYYKLSWVSSAPFQRPHLKGSTESNWHWPLCRMLGSQGTTDFLPLLFPWSSRSLSQPSFDRQEQSCWQLQERAVMLFWMKEASDKWELQKSMDWIPTNSNYFSNFFIIGWIARVKICK